MSASRPPAVLSRRPGTGIRLAVFTSHPIPYNAPLFRSLADEPRLSPVIFYGCRHGLEAYHDQGFERTVAWDIPLLEGYESVFLENRSLRPDPSSYMGVIVPGIRRYWSKGGFDAAMLLGWYTFGHLQALRAAWATGLSVIIRGESTLERGPRSSVLGGFHRKLWVPIRRPLYRRLFARVDAFLTIGSRNEVFYRHFDVPSSKLVRARYTTDNLRFAPPPRERQRARAKIRSALGVGSEATIFLFVGKLAAYKRPFDILEAFRATSDVGRAAFLVFVGDGPLRGALERAAAASKLTHAVRFAGFVNQFDLPRWYAAADCLILASDGSETWGLVVNEAMAAGLPVIVSSSVGCAPDLVREGENGWTYPSGDTAALASLLRRFWSLPAEARNAMGRRSRELVARCTPESVARHCADVLTHVVGRRAE